LLAKRCVNQGQVHNAARRHEYLQLAQQSGDHLLGLIDNILDLSKIEAGVIEVAHLVMPLHDTVEQTIRSVMPLAQQKGLTLNLHIANDVPRQVQTDPVKVRQILLNLTGNAIKFTDQGGIEVRLSAQTLPDAGLHLRIAVRDTGIGFDPEKLESLFSPFVQGDNSSTRKHGGSGLGLAISRKLAHSLGGDISASNLAGAGAEFSLKSSARWPPTSPYQTRCFPRQHYTSKVCAFCLPKITP
jgi:signal transduction histidine kinase